MPIAPRERLGEDEPRNHLAPASDRTRFYGFRPPAPASSQPPCPRGATPSTRHRPAEPRRGPAGITRQTPTPSITANSPARPPQSASRPRPAKATGRSRPTRAPNRQGPHRQRATRNCQRPPLQSNHCTNTGIPRHPNSDQTRKETRPPCPTPSSNQLTAPHHPAAVPGASASPTALLQPVKHGQPQAAATPPTAEKPCISSCQPQNRALRSPTISKGAV
jgi:hypothetical protein